MLNPLEIIQTFDKTITDVWGPSMGRLYPHAKDIVFAQRWVDAGVVIEQIEGVFKDVMNTRKVRSLSIINNLAYFDNIIKDAIATQKYIEKQESSPEENLWKMRLQSFKKFNRWLDTWPPKEMCPRHLLISEGGQRAVPN